MGEHTISFSKMMILLTLLFMAVSAQSQVIDSDLKVRNENQWSNSAYGLTQATTNEMRSALQIQRSYFSNVRIVYSYNEVMADLYSISVIPIRDYTLEIVPKEITETLVVTIVNKQGNVVYYREISGESNIDILIPPALYYMKIKTLEGQLVGLKKMVVT